MAHGALGMARGSVLRLRDAQGLVLQVHEGALWLTQEGDALDRYLGPEPSGTAHDWSAEMRAMYGAIADSAEARRRARPVPRAEGTRPSLALASHAGTYADSLYGMAVVAPDASGLSIQVGESAGTLEHHHYDAFRVRWRDPFLGTDLVSFVLDPDGTVGELRVGQRRYRRAAGRR